MAFAPAAVVAPVDEFERLELAPEPRLLPTRDDPLGVEPGDGLPRLGPRHVPQPDLPDPLADEAGEGVEAGDPVHAAGADRTRARGRRDLVILLGLVVRPDRRHRLDRALEGVDLVDPIRDLQDADRSAAAMLAVHRAGETDRLLNPGDRDVAADLASGDLPNPANPIEVGAPGGLSQPPVEVQLRLAGCGHAAGRHLECRLADVLDEMSPLGRDVAVVEVDHDHCGLGDGLGARPPPLRRRGGDHVAGAAGGERLGGAPDQRRRQAVVDRRARSIAAAVRACPCR